MRKDYRPVPEWGRSGDELDFVETYWTQCWRACGPEIREDEIQGVAEEEEYAVMKPFLSRLPPRARLLDGGCGRGSWTIFLTRQGFQVTGLDICAETIGQLQSRFPQIPFSRGDLRRLEFPDQEFDAFFSWGAFEHFEEGMQPCIREAFRVLKPGGYLFVTVPYQNLRHILQGFSRHRGGSAGPKDDRVGLPVRFFEWRLTAPELIRELTMGGFRVLLIRPITLMLVIERLRRMLHAQLRRESPSFGFTKWALQHLVPLRPVAHMLMGVACRPAESHRTP